MRSKHNDVVRVSFFGLRDDVPGFSLLNTGVDEQGDLESLACGKTVFPGITRGVSHDTDGDNVGYLLLVRVFPIWFEK